MIVQIYYSNSKKTPEGLQREKWKSQKEVEGI